MPSPRPRPDKGGTVWRWRSARCSSAPSCAMVSGGKEADGIAIEFLGPLDHDPMAAAVEGDEADILARSHEFGSAAGRAEPVIEAPEAQYRLAQLAETRREIRYAHGREHFLRLRLRDGEAFRDQRIGDAGRIIDQIAHDRPHARLVEAVRGEGAHHALNARHG